MTASSYDALTIGRGQRNDCQAFDYAAGSGAGMTPRSPSPYRRFTTWPVVFSRGQIGAAIDVQRAWLLRANRASDIFHAGSGWCVMTAERASSDWSRAVSANGQAQHLAPHGRRRDIVVIAASAGGVLALLDIVSALPADFETPIAIVLHRTRRAPRRSRARRARETRVSGEHG